MNAFSSMSILVIEDDESLRNTLDLVLSRAGFAHVEVCGDAPRGIELMQERHFAIVLCDWNMEPISGVELLRLVRAQGALGALPFVLMTANASEAFWLEAMRAGASEFVAKPFGRSALLQTLAHVLGVEGAYAEGADFTRSDGRNSRLLARSRALEVSEAPPLHCFRRTSA